VDAGLNGCGQLADDTAQIEHRPSATIGDGSRDVIRHVTRLLLLLLLMMMMVVVVVVHVVMRA